MSSKSDATYASNNGFITCVWGPGLWHFLHTMSFNYPVNPTQQQKKEYKTFVLSLQHVLPCGHCRDNFPKNLENVPLTAYALRNRNTFSRWMYRFHSHVNAMLNKKTPYTYEEIRDTYESFRAGKCSTKKQNKKHKNNKESGCTEPGKHEVPKKCVIRIVPKNSSYPSFEVL